jgi:hypothetical protein
MNRKKTISTGALILFIMLAIARVLHAEGNFANAQSDPEEENALAGGGEDAKVIFEEWGDFSGAFEGGDGKVDFGMPAVEILSRLGEAGRFETKIEFAYIPNEDVIFCGWKVSRERYVFSEDRTLCRTDTELEFVGGEEPGALRAELERSLGVPVYEGGMKWDDTRDRWTGFRGDADVINAPAYFESQWKTGDAVLEYRQFGTKLMLCQAVLGYQTDGVLAGGAALERINPDTELSLGDFFLGIREGAFWKTLGEKPVLCAEEVSDAESVKTCRFSGGEAVFVKNKTGGEYSLCSISVDSPEYQTRRGLSPLDTVVRLTELYGFPERTDKDDAGNDVWCYGDGEYEYYRFTVREGVVTSINLHDSL